MSMTLQQFNQIQNSLAFPLTVDNKLREVANSFSYTHTLLFNQTEWEAYQTVSVTDDGFPINSRREVRSRRRETYQKKSITEVGVPKVDVLVDPDADVTYLERSKQLFDKTFTRLDELQCAEKIYGWGKNTHTYYKLFDREKSSSIYSQKAWYRVLADWAIGEQLRTPLQSENIISAWNVIKDELNLSSDDETDNDKFELSLSELSSARLVESILVIKSEQILSTKIIDGLILSISSQWEDYVLRRNVVSAWLGNEIDYRLSAKVIDLIMQILSEDEIRLLEAWGLQYKKRYPDLLVPFNAS